MMVAGGALEDATPFLGGLHVQNAVYAIWEAVTGTSLFITTIVLSARRRSSTGSIARSFGQASYGIYLFHAFAITLVGIAMLPLHLHPALKYVLLTGVGVGIPWVLTEALRRVPGARSIV